MPKRGGGASAASAAAAHPTPPPQACPAPAPLPFARLSNRLNQDAIQPFLGIEDVLTLGAACRWTCDVFQPTRLGLKPRGSGETAQRVLTRFLLRRARALEAIWTTDGAVFLALADPAVRRACAGVREIRLLPYGRDYGPFPYTPDYIAGFRTAFKPVPASKKPKKPKKKGAAAAAAAAGGDEEEAEGPLFPANLELLDLTAIGHGKMEDGAWALSLVGRMARDQSRLRSLGRS
jgi:hypothetical protein